MNMNQNKINQIDIERSIKFGPFWIGNKYEIPTILNLLCYYIALQIYYFYFFYRHFYIESILNCISCFLCLFNFFNCVLREPGVIKKVQLQDVEQNRLLRNQMKQTQIFNVYFKERFCKVCNTMCPPKTYHCDDCNNCVKLYDNHADFMGNCIGIRNYKYFIGWVYSSIFQYIIWYVVMIQHFLQKLEYLEWFYEQIIVLFGLLNSLNIIVIILLIYFLFFYKPGLLGKIIKALIIIYILVWMVIPFFYDHGYYNTLFCSLIFVIVTFNGAVNSLKNFIVHSFNIAIGVNQFEWLVLEKLYNSVDSYTKLKVTLQNNNQRLEQREVPINVDPILKEQIISEISANSCLRDLMNNDEFIKNAQSQKKKLNDQLGLKYQAQNTILEHEKNTTFQNYFKNLGKLIISEIPKSELD